MTDLEPGRIVWVNLDPTTGNEQAGHRPCLVVSSRKFSELFPNLVQLVPLTSANKGWDSHVRITPEGSLPLETWAMAEQIRTVSIKRITRVEGVVDHSCLGEVLWWVRAFVARSRAV